MQKNCISNCITGVGVLCIILTSLVPTLAAGTEQGKQVYQESGCSLCHAVGKRGGKSGPDLSEEGNKRDRDWLIRFLKSPKSMLAGSKMPPVKASEEDLAALADYLVSLKKEP